MNRLLKVKDFLLCIAEIIDTWRIVPRIIIFYYCIFTWRVFEWIRELENPSVEQTGVMYAVIGALPMIFNFYAKSGVRWSPRVDWDGVGENDYLSNQGQGRYGRTRYPSSCSTRNRRYSTTTRREVRQKDQEFIEEEDQ